MAAGFTVRDEPFAFSEFPSRWLPALIALVVAVVVMRVGHAAVVSRETVASLVIAVITLAAAALATGYFMRKGVLDFPMSRRSSTNLIATPAKREPDIWLVAHLDSKSQTIPMLARITAVTVFAFSAAVVLVAAAVVAIAGTGMPDVQHQASAVAHHASLAVMVGSLPLVFCFIGNRSRGALDNASGVAAVLLAAERLKGRNVGVLLTSAEELGLAGARAFVRAHPVPGTAINCDTIDDSGNMLFMRSRRPSRGLERAVEAACARSAAPVHGRGMRPMLPGVLADNIAFSDAGWDSVTISRGNIGTLGRVHTSRDRAGPVHGTGIAQASLLVAAIVEELT